MIRCQECGAEGAVCVFPDSQLSEAELRVQRVGKPDEAIIGLRTMALCSSCRRDLRQEQRIEIVVAEDFVRMRAKHLPVELVGAARELPTNPTLAMLQRRYGL